MKKTNNNYILILVVATVLIIGVIFYFLTSNSKDKQVDTVDSNTTYEVTPTMKPVSKDNSFSAIEKDLDSTVILEEDFSDL